MNVIVGSRLIAKRDTWLNGMTDRSDSKILTKDNIYVINDKWDDMVVFKSDLVDNHNWYIKDLSRYFFKYIPISFKQITVL